MCQNHVWNHFRDHFRKQLLNSLVTIVELFGMIFEFRRPLGRWGHQAAKDFLYPVSWLLSKIGLKTFQKHVNMTSKSTESQYLRKNDFGDTS